MTISVSAETDAGKRKHMEDYLDVRLSPNEALRGIPGLKDQAFVGVFDGHGGKEAALYARERLWDLIQEQLKFRSTDREKVVEAIVDAYWSLHKEMQPMRSKYSPPQPLSGAERGSAFLNCMSVISLVCVCV